MAKGFGSFFNKPVEELLDFPGSVCDYVDYSGIAEAVKGCEEVFQSSRDVDASDMHPGISNSGFTFLNQGAFGGAKQPLLDIANYWRTLQQKQPLVFFDRVLLPVSVMAVRSLAEFFSVTPREVFLFPNATYGLNTILSNVKSDETVLFSTTYGSVKKMVKTYSTPPRTTLIEIPISHIRKWTSERELLKWFEGCLLSLKPPRERTVIMLESVSSNTAIKWPYLAMAAKAKEINKRFYVVVDAAHQLGMFSVNDPVKNVDAFITNGHKWLGTPSGVGVVILPEYKQGSISTDKTVSTPLVISHGSESSFSSATLWHGHVDYSSWLTVPWALRLLSHQSTFLEERVTPLANTAEALLISHWNVPAAYAPFITAPFMRLVELPAGIQALFAGRGSDLQNVLHSHQIECPVKDLDGVLYVRVSVFTYNTISHYERLAKVVMVIAKGGDSKL